ncbi:unnamed protein product [Cuscuta campestris]|uniref:Uncharacterized protein n=1 Tax=Cuscuta campestris TaxID=132261 RepID=A0A484LPE7_9ASTE|nr:unnamed protein product [Cuscuta campestris]
MEIDHIHYGPRAGTVGSEGGVGVGGRWDPERGSDREAIAVDDWWGMGEEKRKSVGRPGGVGEGEGWRDLWVWWVGRNSDVLR